jgi:maltooligosyltrehalose trehalohydrolase
MSNIPFGATPLSDGGARFRVWAPDVDALAVKIHGRILPANRVGEDFELYVAEAKAGDEYSLILNGSAERPDPVSRSQPHGVHGPSEIVDPYAFHWSDHEWNGVPLEDYVLYELHVGTFTPEGTFAGVVSKLPYLKALGITAIELMPVAEFPGSRNWGYDGVDLYAPHSAYGGPEGLKTLVNAAHREGLAVVLDVVYNHVGPEGNYLGEFGPYFTDNYRTPWGRALNFDGPGSDGVRRFFIENALYWLTEFHMDALRLDAIHGIFDFSALHMLEELGERFHAQATRLGRQAWIIAESDLNDVRVIKPRSEGGYELDAQWHDEFHHSVVSFATRQDRGFLGGFGQLEHIRKAITEGFVYDGVYSSHRKRRFGNSAIDRPGYRFVAFLQNHDQIANTNQGVRLSELLPLHQLKAAVALLLCSPYLPLLFMGEEFADTAPFLYFTSHGDSDLAKAVSLGRKQEFADFTGEGEFLDPQSPEAFEKSKVTWRLELQPPHYEVLRFYRELIALRKRLRCLSNGRKDLTQVMIDEESRVLQMERSDPDGSRALLICNFGDGPLPVDPEGEWQVALRTPAAMIYIQPRSVT